MAIDNRLNDIHIDWTGEFIFGYEQAYDTFPCVFPTVNIVVYGEGLCSLADDIRKRNGDSEELNGWYDFNIGLNGFTKSHIDNCIHVVANSDYIDDDGNVNFHSEEYDIPLNEDEQDFVYNLLDAQLRNGGHEDGINFKTSCESLLIEASLYVEEDAGGKLTILHRSINA